MPFKSAAQRRLMMAAAHARPGKGRKYKVSPEVSRKFVADSKGSTADLPERVKKK